MKTNLGEDRLFPEVGLVCPYLVPCHNTDLITGGVEFYPRGASDHDEGVEEVRLDAARGEPRVIRLEENHTYNVITNVSLPLELLGVALLVGEEGGHVEHDLYPPPMRVDAVETREVVHRVQAALILVKTLQLDFVPQYCEKLVKALTVIIVVKYLFFSVLSLLYIDYPHFQF